MLLLGLGVPYSITLDIEVKDAPPTLSDEPVTRRGSLVIALYAQTFIEGSPYWTVEPVARVWGDDGRVPKPYAGLRLRKSVRLPRGIRSPLKVGLTWVPGKVGRRKLDLIPLDTVPAGTRFGWTDPVPAGSHVRLNSRFDSRHPNQADLSQLYGTEPIG